MSSKVSRHSTLPITSPPSTGTAITQAPIVWPAGERSAILVEADDDTTEATSFAALQRASRALARRLGDLHVVALLDERERAVFFGLALLGHDAGVDDVAHVGGVLDRRRLQEVDGELLLRAGANGLCQGHQSQPRGL